MENDVSLVLSFAMKTGTVLLENGAEISRVEDTMRRVAEAYGVRHDSFFVLSNGIFTTGWSPESHMEGSFAKVAHIPLKGIRLDRIVAVNQLSREICAGKLSIADAEARLDAIRVSPNKPVWLQLLGAFIGSSAFCVLFGGSLADSVVSSLAGLGVWLFVLLSAKLKFSKITLNLVGSAWATLLCAVLARFGLGESLGQMVIGSVITLIPGVALTNGVRDIADGDYISGSVRLLDALLGFLCIGVGVGGMFLFLRRFAGGALL